MNYSTSRLRRRPENNKYINFIETKNIIEARKSLIRMVDFLDSSNKVKIYLLEQCNYLLKPLTGNTGIQINNNLPETQISINLNMEGKFKEVSKFLDVSGVYLFMHKDSVSFYIGSAISFYSRFKSHLINSTRVSRGGNSKFYKFVKYNGDWSNFNWGIIKFTPNHISNFLNINPSITLNSIELNILLYFNQAHMREVRAYEQALLNHFQPSLNTSNSVTFGFANWQPNLNLNKKIEIKVYAKNKSLIATFPSRTVAAKELEISLTTVNRYLNKNFMVESPKLDMFIYILNPNKPIVLSSDNKITFESSKYLPTITDFDL